MHKYRHWKQRKNYMHLSENAEAINPMFQITVTCDENTGSTTYDISHSFEDRKLLCRLLRDFIGYNGEAENE